MENQETDNTRKQLIIAVAGGLVLLVMLSLVASALGLGAVLFKSRADRSTELTASQPDIRFQEMEAGESGKRAVAALEDARGLVSILHTNGSWTPVQAGDRVGAGQRVRTGDLSGVALRFPDGSRAILGANAEVSIDEIRTSKDGEERIVRLTQWSGESEHRVIPNTSEGSLYEVDTPSGTGQARGTVFHVFVNPLSGSRFAVLEGAVAVTSVRVTVLVEAGYVSFAPLSEPPAEPVLYIRPFEGVVSEVGQTWVIGDFAFQTHADTLILGDPQVGDLVLVEGRILADETRLADRIILVRRALVNSFSFTGLVDAIGDDSWTIAGQTVAISETTQIDEGIQAGSLVRVEGRVAESGELEAERIRLVQAALGTPFEFVGVIQVIGENDWAVSGVLISLSEDTEVAGDFDVGDLVKVEGWILEDGRWLAVEIQPAGEQIAQFEFTGFIESMDPWVVAGIAFQVREWTEIDTGLAAGDLVHVEGQILEDGSWVAYEVRRIDESLNARITLIGTVISMDPWVVSGVPILVDGDTLILGEVSIGMLVRVEIELLPDGAWRAVSIESLEEVVWFPGCMDIIATVISVSGDQLQVDGWPVLLLPEDLEFEGVLIPGSVIRFRVCFNEDMTITIVYLVIIYEPEPDVEDTVGHKVTVCHKPNGPNPHSITIDRSALGAHLGHGDYIGPCVGGGGKKKK